MRLSLHRPAPPARFGEKKVGAKLATGDKYADIPCMSSALYDIGNGGFCDDYDFSSCDLNGTANRWWDLFKDTDEATARGNLTATGALAARADEGCGTLGTSDAESQTIDDYLLAEKPYARHNPKNWHKEEFYELIFLGALKQLCDDGKVIEALQLMSAFIQRKSKFRDQWVTRVPGFIPVGGEASFNGRSRYIVARIWLRDPSAYVQQNKPLYFYVPASAGWLQQYKDDSGKWRFLPQGEFGVPGNVVAPGDDPSCDVRVGIQTAITAADFLWTVWQDATSPSIVSKAFNYFIQMALTAVTQAASGKPLDLGSPDFTGLGAELDGIENLYSFSIAGCTGKSEYNIFCRNFVGDSSDPNWGDDCYYTVIDAGTDTGTTTTVVPNTSGGIGALITVTVDGKTYTAQVTGYASLAPAGKMFSAAAATVTATIVAGSTPGIVAQQTTDPATTTPTMTVDPKTGDIVLPTYQSPPTGPGPGAPPIDYQPPWLDPLAMAYRQRALGQQGNGRRLLGIGIALLALWAWRK